MEIAGSTCVAYSTMSSCRWGLLDNSAAVLLVWLHWVRHCKFDWVLHECVPGLDVAAIAKDILCDGEDGAFAPGTSVVNAPVDFGVPAERRRRWTCWSQPLRHRQAAAEPSDADAAEECPVVDTSHALRHLFDFNARNMQRLFYRKLVCDGSAFLIALPEEVQHFYEQRARMRKALLPQASAQADEGESAKQFANVEVEDLVCACARAHLQGYVDLADTSTSFGEVSADFVCLMQSPYHMGVSSKATVPVLLRQSLIYSLRQRRLVLPDELMLAMGVPSPLAQLSSSEMAALCPWGPTQSLSGLVAEVEARKMIGNGMHRAPLAAAILLILARALAT